MKYFDFLKIIYIRKKKSLQASLLKFLNQDKIL